MKKLLAGLVVAGALAVPFAGTASAVGGCQEFGEVTAAGTPWGQATKDINLNPSNPPTIIKTNTLGAHATFCP